MFTAQRIVHIAENFDFRIDEQTLINLRIGIGSFDLCDAFQFAAAEFEQFSVRVPKHPSECLSCSNSAIHCRAPTDCEPNPFGTATHCVGQQFTSAQRGG